MITYVNRFISWGLGNDQCKAAVGIAIDATRIYVSDILLEKVVIFDIAGLAYVNRFGSLGVGDGQFTNVVDIDVDDNYIYVVDKDNHRVQIFNKTTFAFVNKFGTNGAGDGEFSTPVGICVDANYVYVTDAGNDRVQIFNKSTYAFLGKYGTPGSGDDQFNLAYGICTDNTYVYVLDKLATGNSRVKVLSNGPTPVLQSHITIGDAGFSPYGVAVDSNYVYVAYQTGHRVMSYDKVSGALVDTFGTGVEGTGDDQLASPACIAVAAPLIYVTNTNELTNGFVRILQVTPPAPPADPTLLTATCSTGIGESTLPDAPHASFSADVTNGVAPLTVAFTDLSSESPTSWLWEFGGGVTSTAQNPTHVFAIGIHAVRLTATNAHGSTSFQMTIVATETAVIPVPDGGTLTEASIQGIIGSIGYFAVDSENNTVKIHGANGALLKTFGGLGTQAGKFFRPTTCSVVGGRQLLDRVVID
jgi:PKD repeat protein